MNAQQLADAQQQITAAFPKVNNHPDVAGVLRQPALLAILGKAMAAPFADANIDVVMAPEARGPILGALVACELGAGLVLARKAETNHPGADLVVESQPTWRGQPQTFQGRTFDLDAKERVLLVDDWVTTGNSLRAAADIIAQCDATYVGASVLVNKADPETLAELNVATMVAFADI